MVIDYEKFKEILTRLTYPNSSVGLHGISGGVSNEYFNSIFENGLIKLKWGGILGLFNMYGNANELTEQTISEMWDYKYQVDDNFNYANVIVSIPNIFVNQNGNRYFVGNFPKNDSNFFVKGDKNYGANLPINKYVDSLRKVPTEFILGIVFYNNKDNKVYFYLNKNYLALKEVEEIKEYGGKIEEQLINVGAVEMQNIEAYIPTYLRFFPEDADDLYIRQLQQILENRKKKKSR